MSYLEKHKALSSKWHHIPHLPLKKEYFLSVSCLFSLFLIQLHVSQPVFFTLTEAKTSRCNLSKSLHSSFLMFGPPQLWWLQRQQWLAGHNNSRWELEGREGVNASSRVWIERQMREIFWRKCFAPCCILSLFCFLFSFLPENYQRILPKIKLIDISDIVQ